MQYLGNGSVDLHEIRHDEACCHYELYYADHALHLLFYVIKRQKIRWLPPSWITASLSQISWWSVKPWPRYGDFFIFPRWWLSAILDLLCACSDHHEGHLVVFIAVQGLVGIDVVVLIICMFFHFTSLAWKHLFTPQNVFLAILPPKWGAMSAKPKKAHSTSFEPSCAKISQRVWLVGEFPKNGNKENLGYI